MAGTPQNGCLRRRTNNMNKKSTFADLISWLFAVIVMAIAVVNIFWGNDAGFGVFLLLLSFVYMPPVTRMIKQRFGFSVPLIAKILLGVFIIWASLGVGELFDKIDMMLTDLS